MSQTIGRYRVLEKIGEGGMGVVYSAHDEGLQRRVAIKTIRDAGSTELRERFWREARAAARVSHPNICPIYEVGEHEGTLFLAMELLEGQSLADRLKRGPLEPAEALNVTGSALAALEAVHRHGLVHRDLKPSNVFLTPHGVKLLDFGLARSTGLDGNSGRDLTQTGLLLGTPRYMAPEQAAGRPLDARADLFAVGAMLYEMLVGRPAFDGATIMEVLQAVTYSPTPPLGGSAVLDSLDRVIRRATAKAPEERWGSAAEMGQALRELAPRIGESGAPSRVGDSSSTRPLPGVGSSTTRLIVFPFRMLRPDPDTEFLTFSLPDAVAASLAGLESLVVRPTASAAAFAGASPDLAEVARRANVDVVLTGTLLRSGDQVRVTTQLLQVPEGALVASHASQAPLGDLFQLQDELAQRIVDALALPLTTRERGLVHQDVPADPAAYELYLRANQLMTEPRSWQDALDLYRRCCDRDPRYAPAWAGLGRSARVIAKYGGDDPTGLMRTAEDAFRRALELNPDLSNAHHLHAYLEVEMGRARFAMVRLLDRLRSRRRDPELFGGLVLACRYCGLLDASAAAHERALQIDPGIVTSVAYTYNLQGRWEKALTAEQGSIWFARQHALIMLGRLDEVRQATDESLRHMDSPGLQTAMRGYMAAAEGRREGFMPLLGRGPLRDPEAHTLVARAAIHLGLVEEGLRLLEHAVLGGHFCAPFLRSDTWLDPARERDDFRRILGLAESRHREAREHYLAAGGETLLGVGTAGV
jgi:serine/threonine-protein kinase